jgi:hypothetical protein
MGEVEQTLERLNKVLVEAGFPKVNYIHMGKGEYWYLENQISLRFDKDGKYIAPEGGEY